MCHLLNDVIYCYVSYLLNEVGKRGVGFFKIIIWLCVKAISQIEIKLKFRGEKTRITCEQLCLIVMSCFPCV